MVALLVPGDRPERVGFGPQRFEPDRLRVVGDTLVRLPGISVRLPPLVVDGRVVQTVLDRLVEVADGCAVGTALGAEAAAVVVGRGEARLAPERLGERGNRLVDLPLR